jgi:hypothetical protein
VNIKFKNIAFSTGIILLIGLSGCAGYKARPLHILPAFSPEANSDDPYVTFSYHVFSKYDCKRHLDRDIVGEGYIPIQITIKNHTPHKMFFSTGQFDFPCVPAETVAQEVHTSTVTRAAGYGVPGIVLWPLLVPAIIDGFGSYEANNKLDTDFSEKELYDQTISPYGKANGLIFVPKESFHEMFSLILTDLENKTYITLSTLNQSTTLQRQHSISQSTPL